MNLITLSHYWGRGSRVVRVVEWSHGGATAHEGQGLLYPSQYTRPLGTEMHEQMSDQVVVAVVAEWYGYRTVACFVTGSSPVPLKTRRVGQRCTLNLSRAETSSRWWWW
ncbi:uncharacterized protein TNCV_4123831 [Trichonephila clavipes]|nr:uncharacterized protein TNCV_4123831 [Trichonephila clavipes]